MNRKKNTEGNKINWFDFRSLIHRKQEPFILNSICCDGIEQKTCIKKKGTTDETLIMCDTSILYPGGRSISKKKFDDLIQLLKFVPKEHHDFFNNLKFDNEEDYGLASDDEDV